MNSIPAGNKRPGCTGANNLPKYWHLCAIIDEAFLRGRSAGKVAEQIADGGASVIQYRNKSGDTPFKVSRAIEIREHTAGRGIPLIINDDVTVAIDAGADGVHLGPMDMPVTAARKIAGTLLIGYSVQRIEDLKMAEGADYLGIGALYPTETHKTYPVMGPESVRTIRKLTDLPLIGIGGITLNRVEAVLRDGCDGIAVISAILNAGDAALMTARLLNEIIRIKDLLSSER